MTDTTAIANWLERNYQPAKLGNAALKDAPLTAWLPHNESAGGENLTLRWEYNMPQAQGRTYTQAKTRSSATGSGATGLKSVAVMLDYHPWYSVAEVDNLAIERAAGGNLAATEILQKHIKRANEAHGDWLETVMWSDGYPSLGAIGNISGSTFTVAQSDIENWEQEMEIVLAASRTTGALRNAGASLYVTKVDRTVVNGVCTITCHAGIVATIAAAANGDFAFIKTSREDAASPTYQTALGIQAFIPETLSGADAFGSGSFNRSVDRQRLAGMKHIIPAGVSVQQGLIDYFVNCRKYKLNPDGLWCSFERWGRLIQEMGNNVRYVNVENKKYGVNIEGVKLFTSKGEVTVFPSAKCPDQYVFGLKRDCWKIYSVNGALIRPATRYQKALDSSTGDLVELRYRSFHQLGCITPMENSIGVFS